MQHWQELIITIIGWVYFAAWSISFYGQIYQNFKHKNVQGMNFDFVAMNLTGFTFYSLYNSYGYFVNSEQTGKVDLNDVFFAYHALFATLICCIQISMYPKGRNKIHAPTVILLLVMWSFIIVWSTLTMWTKTVSVGKQLGVFSFMGYFKLCISTLKYLPQMYWNYQRKSTKGWSIFNILMDLTGGVLSFLQMFLQVMFGQHVQVNYIKLALGILVVVYDCIFVFQHYCLYKEDRIKQRDQKRYSQLTEETIPPV